MQEIKGNIWDYHKDNWIVIPTNGYTRRDGTAVMGRGLAKQCANRYPNMQAHLGSLLRKYGNHVFSFPEPLRLFTYPVKYNWWEKADLGLIEDSAAELVQRVDELKLGKVFLPQVGCGNDGRYWVDVRKHLLGWLDQRFTVVEFQL